jgi:1-acyl-sn-glycerol-3-phosphate acyltransferase
MLVPYWFVPIRYVDWVVQRWSATNGWLQKVICGLQVDIQGQQHLTTTPCIFLIKHQSAWETISLHHYLPKKQSWVLKQELLQIPLLGWALRAGNFIPIDRKAGRRAIIQLIRAGTESLQNHRSVIIFPEGTRTAPGERQKYNIGGALLAQKTGFPVVPIAHNAGVYWARQGLRKYPGTIQVRIGAPIDTTGKTAQQILEETETWIENTMQMLATHR